MANKRVKIWFDDEGEPHETIVEDEPETSVGPTPAVDPAMGARRTRVWFDDEGEPHEAPLDEPQPADGKTTQVWFDDEGMPHDSPRAAAAANARVQAERTQISAPPQTHSSFTQGLTPKPMYFERVETQRDGTSPQPAARAPAARPMTPAAPRTTSGTPTPAPRQTPAVQPAPGGGPAAVPGVVTQGPAATQRAPAPRAAPAMRTATPQPQAAPRAAPRPESRESSTAQTVVAAQPRVGASTSLATNYRAAVAHAAMADGAAARSGRVETPSRAPAPGADSPADDSFQERTVATAAPLPSQFAATRQPAAGRQTLTPHAPVVSRPTLTHTPMPMDDKAHEKRPSGGFFNRGRETPAAPVAPGSGGLFSRPTAVPTPQPRVAPSSGGFFGRSPEALPATPPAPSTPDSFFSQPVIEPARPAARRITEPMSSPAPAPAPTPATRAAPVRRDTVHEQATVVRESPFLHSEPTVVRNPVSEEVNDAPMRRRLTEPMLARGPGFIAPAQQGIATETAPLWRLAVAAGIDGCAAAVVGVGTAAAEMLMFGGHWPAEATNAMDALALWLHNYPGTERRAVLVTLLFTWCYAALGARTGRTPGRMLMRLIAVQEDGAMMTWSRAAWRSLASLLSALCFGAGYFWAVVDSRHRGLHDIVSRSIVVRRKPT